jgi:hypothetical protein
VRGSAVALALAILTPTQARADCDAACQDRVRAAFAAIAVTIAADCAVTAVDVTYAIKRRRVPLWFAAAEITLASPQLVLAIAERDESSLLWAHAAWMSAMVAHGLVTLLMPERTVRVVPFLPDAGGGGVTLTAGF